MTRARSPAATDRIREVLDLAMARPAGEREAFVSGACGSDRGLREEVLSLLGVLEAAGDLLEPPTVVPSAEPLTGLRFGTLTVGRRIGEGGMGLVYEALDSRLGRTVAVKALPPAFVRDPHRRARFEQEARTLAALNHTNIGAIYGVEETPRGPVMVLEHIPGETLADRLSRGPLPIPETLRIARQIARALEAAHGSGVIHRDLKPANIRVMPDGGVKVLDFGIAKTLGLPDSAPQNPQDAEPLRTRAGEVLGTAAYMSPEQARGQPVDRRADLWALGCVVCEMLTGKRTFAGATSSDTIAALLRGEPGWETLPSDTPPALSRLLRRCLVKDPERRLRDAGDAGLELDLAEEEFSEPATPLRAGRRLVSARTAALVVLSVLVAVAVTTAISPRRAPAPAPAPVVRLALPIPDGRAVSPTAPGVAIAPGVVAVAARKDGAQNMLYLRSGDQTDLTVVPGTEGADAPFISPDQRWVGYFNSITSALHRVPVDGGAPVLVAQADANAYSGVWMRDGTIFYSVLWSSGLFQIRPGSSAGELVTTNDISRGHVRCTAEVPGGRWVLLTTGRPDRGGVTRRIEALDRGTGEQRVVVDRGGDARLLPDGTMVFARDGGLLAAPFDSARLMLTGEPRLVVNPVSMAGATGPTFAALSPDGSLAYVPGPIRYPEGELAWFSRTGVVTPILSGVRGNHDPAVSPDGTRVAFSIQDETTELYVLDTRRPEPVPFRLTEGLNCGYPTWSPDGAWIYFAKFNPGAEVSALYRVRSDGSAPPEHLTSAYSPVHPCSLTPDGLTLLFSGVPKGGKGSDLMLLSLKDGTVREFLATPAIEIWGMISPDGKTVAYVTEELDRSEVFLLPFPGPGPRVQVSTAGGYRPRWKGDGTELFFQYEDQIWSARITHTPDGVAGAGQPTKLFEGRFITRYGAHPDGDRFVAPRETGSDTPLDRVLVIVNWQDEVRRRLLR